MSVRHQFQNTLARAAAIALLGTTALSGTVSAEPGDLLVRGRIIGVLPNEDASVTPLGGSVEIDDSFVPEVDFTYFFTDRIAAELILATAPHDVKATAAGGIDLGSVWHVPPTVTLQYHFVNASPLTPYVGAGVNYTFFWNEDPPAGISIDYDDSFGGALQAGLDYKLSERWVLNADIKHIWINTDVTINGGAITADVDIDPWVVGVGLGYRF